MDEDLPEHTPDTYGGGSRSKVNHVNTGFCGTLDSKCQNRSTFVTQCVLFGFKDSFNPVNLGVDRLKTLQ